LFWPLRCRVSTVIGGDGQESVSFDFAMFSGLSFTTPGCPTGVYRPTAIFAGGIGANPAATRYVNRSADPRLTKPYNTMIYNAINRQKD
jgi:hypothetical protein